MFDDGLANMIRREAAQPANARAPIRVAEVTSYDPDTHSVKAKILPDGTETGWFPLGVIHVGKGHGIAAGATEGDQLVVGFLEGDHSAPVVLSRLGSDDQPPPKVKSGEIAIWHKSGTRDFFSADGTHTKTHAKGGTVTWDKDGNLTTDNKAMAVATNAATIASTAAKTLTSKAGQGIVQQAGKILLNCG